MNLKNYRKDPVVLVADKDMEFFLRGILNRPEALGIKQVNFEIFRHPQKDPGCRLIGHDFLRPLTKIYQHALIILDHEGCGKESLNRDALELEIENRLRTSGWNDRAGAIVIDPELENWAWSTSPEVDRILGWQGKSATLRTWLLNNGFLSKDSMKPCPPKKALRETLRNVRKPWSASIFHQIAQTVSLKQCADPAFQKLKATLLNWFPTTKTEINV